MATNTTEYTLHPMYDKRSSFYGKAVTIEHEDGSIELRSYSTIVAKISTSSDSLKTAEVYGWYSATTGRHIKEFLKQYGFKAESKDQILKDYLKEE